MNTLELDRLLTSDPLIQSFHQGVFASDQLKDLKPPPVPGLYVCNNDPSHKPGQHWVAMFLSYNLNKEVTGEYFCSYGKRPLPPFERFLQTFCVTWDENTQRLQDNLSSVCGHYVVYYAYHRTRMRTFKDILNDFSTRDFSRNDYFVKCFIDQHFKAVEVVSVVL